MTSPSPSPSPVLVLKVSCVHSATRHNIHMYHYQDGRVVKALDLSSNGRVVRVGSNPTPGNNFFFEQPCSAVLCKVVLLGNEVSKTREY